MRSRLLAPALVTFAFPAGATEPPSDYRAPILVADAWGAAAVPLVVGVGYAADRQHWIQAPTVAFSMLPTMLFPSTTHLVHGQWRESIVSFAGWSTVGVVAWTLNHDLTTPRLICNEPPCRDQNTGSAVAPTIIAVAGAAGMTMLDWWMARGPASLPQSESAPYAVDVLVADSLAVASVGVTFATGYFTVFHDIPRGTYAAFMLPPLTMGPIVHLVHRRWIAALSSFLGWTTTSLTSIGIAEFAGIFSPNGPGVGGAGVGLLNAGLGALIVTGIDVGLAIRRHEPKKPVLDPLE